MPQSIEASLIKPLDMETIEAELIKNKNHTLPLQIRPKKKKVIYTANVAYPGMFKK